MKRLNARERATLRDLEQEIVALRADDWRRLRNALLALASEDPRWMFWVEREIDTEVMTLPEVTRLVEARTRALMWKRYRAVFVESQLSEFLFCDRPFTDNGALSSG